MTAWILTFFNDLVLNTGGGLVRGSVPDPTVQGNNTADVPDLSRFHTAVYSPAQLLQKSERMRQQVLRCWVASWPDMMLLING